MKTVLTCTLKQGLPIGTVLRVDEHEGVYSLEYDIVERRSACLAMSGGATEAPAVPPVALPMVIDAPRKERVHKETAELREKILDHLRRSPNGDLSSTMIASLIFGSTVTRKKRDAVTSQLQRLRGMGIATNNFGSSKRSEYWRMVTK